MREPDSIARVRLRLKAGGWVPICQQNALELLKDPLVEVVVKPFCRSWQAMDRSYEHRPRAQFRARLINT
jgi:hypothetical protein